MKLLTLIIILSFNVHANDEIQYRINHFKKSMKIAQKTILDLNSGQMLQQSYDLNGKLRIEVETKSSKTRSMCIMSNSKKILDTSSEMYFTCLQQYQEAVASENGIKEGLPRYSPDKNDLKFSDLGKNLEKREAK